MELVRRTIDAVLFPQRAGQRTMPRVDLLIMLFAAAGGALLVAADIFQRWIYYRRIPTLNIDGQGNPETWFHSTVLAGAAISALGIAMTFFDNGRRLRWLGVAACIGFFSLDKGVSVHERVGMYLNDAVGMYDRAASVLWEIAWAPLIGATVVLLILCLRDASTTTRLWVLLAVFFGATKVGMEAMTYPLIRLGVTTEQGWLYGIETEIEESVQLMGFAAFFAAFAQLFVDRMSALARVELAAPLQEPVAAATPAVPDTPPTAALPGTTARRSPAR